MVDSTSFSQLIAQTVKTAQDNAERLGAQESLVMRSDDDTALIGFDQAHLRMKRSGEVSIVCLIDGQTREIPIQLIWDKLFPKEVAGHPND
jgi:hypothetical protein